MGTVIAPPARECGKTKQACVCACYFHWTGSGVYNSMRVAWVLVLCTVDAFMRSHLAKQLVANKGVSAHRLIFGFVGTGPIVDASTTLQHGRGT